MAWMPSMLVEELKYPGSALSAFFDAGHQLRLGVLGRRLEVLGQGRRRRRRFGRRGDGHGRGLSAAGSAALVERSRSMARSAKCSTGSAA